MFVCVYVCAYVCVSVCMFVCINIYVFFHTFLYIYMCMYMCSHVLCICEYIQGYCFLNLSFLYYLSEGMPQIQFSGRILVFFYELLLPVEENWIFWFGNSNFLSSILCFIHNVCFFLSVLWWEWNKMFCLIV